MKTTLILLLALCVVLTAAGGGSFGFRFKKDPFDFDISTSKLVSVKKVPFKGAFEKRFNYYGYHGDHFVEEDDDDKFEIDLLPSRAGKYYYDGSDYHLIHDDSYGTYYLYKHIRYYIIIKSFPKFFEFIEDDYDYDYDYDYEKDGDDDDDDDGKYDDDDDDDGKYDDDDDDKKDPKYYYYLSKGHFVKRAYLYGHGKKG